MTITYADGSTKVVQASWRTHGFLRDIVRLDRGNVARAIADAAGGGRGGDTALARSAAMRYFDM